MKLTTTILALLLVAHVASKRNVRKAAFNRLFNFRKWYRTSVPSGSSSHSNPSPHSSTGSSGPSITTIPSWTCLTVDPHTMKLFSFYNLQRVKDYTMNGTNYSVDFNMCTSPKSSVITSAGCDADKTIGGFVKQHTSNGSTCLPIFTPQSELKITVNTLANTDNVTDVVMVVTPNPKFTHTETLKTTFKLVCNHAAVNDTPPSISFNSATTPPSLMITFTTSSACGTDTQKLLLLFQQYKVFSAMFIIISLPMIFLGFKFLKHSLAGIGFIAGLISTAFVVSLFTNFLAWHGALPWIGLTAGAIIVGLLVAFLCYQSPDIAVLIAGTVLGYFVGNKLVALYSNFSHGSLNAYLVGVIIGLFMCAGFIVAWKLKKHAIILATSFGGAQLFVLGVGTLADNYPDYATIAYYVRTKQYSRVGTWAWVYLGISLVLFIAGAIVQFRHYSQHKENGGDDEDFNAKAGAGYGEYTGDANYY